MTFISSTEILIAMKNFKHPFNCNNLRMFLVYKFFHGFRRMVALITVFFMPELIDLIGTRILVNSSFVAKVFWNAIKSREKTGEKRGDFIDLLLQLKHGKQNPDYSK